VFFRNAWYVAASDADVDRSLLRVALLDEHVVLFRSMSGAPIALEDACAHRKLPLSMGRLKDDEVECGYHGLRYDAGGSCTHVPCQTRVPPGAKVRSYPVVSRYGFVWIWMGSPALADETKIFRVENYEALGWTRNRGGQMVVNCNYLHITDNLLDPSHVAWVHKTSFGNDACATGQIGVTDGSEGVVASRWMRSVEVAPFYSPFVSFEGKCDRLQHYEVRYPSHAFVRALLVPEGTSGEGESHDHAMIIDSYNFLTPITERQTRYFWFQLRNFAADDLAVSSAIDRDVAAAFAEDKVVLEGVQAGFDERPSGNIDLATDQAPKVFRRNLAQRIAKERA
jgi:vanillate O-demethylase monooxygenase subunit